MSQLAYKCNAPAEIAIENTKVKEKTESTLARLGRLTVESGTAKDKGEFKRKMILFEYVGAAHHDGAPADTTQDS